MNAMNTGEQVILLDVTQAESGDTVTGTPAGDLFGVPHSGKSFGIDGYRCSDD